MKTLPLLSLAVSLTQLTSQLQAVPVLLNSDQQVYNQTFNSLPFTTNNAGASTRWNNELSLASWFIHQAGNAFQEPSAGSFLPANSTWYVADGFLPPSASTLGFGVYSLGEPGATDRSLGLVPSSETGELSAIILFKNTRSYSMKLDNLSYMARAYRKNSGFNSERITLSYRVFNTAEDLQTSMTTSMLGNGRIITGWTKIENATAAFPMTEVDNNGLPVTDFNPPKQVYIDDITPRTSTGAPLAVLVPSGRFIALRWGNTNDVGTDGMLGIDDVRLSFQEQVCDLNATLTSEPTRGPGSLPLDPTDDVVSVTADIYPSGGSSSSLYKITAPVSLIATNLDYGPRTFNFPISAFASTLDHTVTLQLEDAENPVCVAQLKIEAPWCGHTVAASNPIITGSTYSLDIKVTGQYVGTLFSLSSTPPVSGTLGSSYRVENLPLSGPTTLRLKDQFPGQDPLFSTCSTFVTFSPPRTIGDNLVDNTPIYASLAPADSNNPWVVSTTAKTTTLNNGGVEAGTALRTEKITLAPATNLQRITADLEVMETSNNSNFETDDQVKVELLVNEGQATEQTINLTDEYDRQVFNNPAGSHWINGYTTANGLIYNNYRNFDEFNKAATNGTSGAADIESLTAVFPLSTIVPNGSTTLRLIITGDNDSAEETFVLKNLKLENVIPALIVSQPTNIVRLEGLTPDAADDKVSFQVRISNTVGGTGWKATPASPSTGEFGNVTLTIDQSQTTVLVTDTDHPELTQTITVQAPQRYVIGKNQISGRDISSKLDTFPDAEWVNLNPTANPSLKLSNSNSIEKTVLSEVIPLTDIAGDLELAAVLEATDTSGSTNFEANDQFRAELIFNGNTAAPVSLINPLWDRNEFTGSRVGYLNGYDGSDDFPYDDYRIRDEFNRGSIAPIQPGVHPLSARWTSRFEMKSLIPDSVQSVQLKIYGANNSTTEIFEVKEVFLRRSTVDTDRDGITDTYENAHGLNPTDPDDAESDLDGDGFTNLAEFRRGTSANNAGSKELRIRNITPAGNAFEITFPGVTGAGYQVEYSENLLGPWASKGVPVYGNGNLATQVLKSDLTVGAGKGFFRLRPVP